MWDLTVSGCGELMPEDKDWLDEHLESVTWDEWYGGRSARDSE